MRNVTITVDEQLAKWARVWAAEHDTSISGMVADMLRARMEESNRYARSMSSFLRRRPKPLKADGAYPKRDDLYDRSVLR